MTELIDGYDEMTVDDAKAAIDSGEFTDAELVRISDYERAHKERVTLLEWLETRLPDADTDADSDGAEAGSDDEDEPEPAAEDEPADDGSDATLTEDGPEEIVVTAADGSTGYLAGLLFEAAYEHKTVTRTRRIEEALEEGALREVSVS